MCELRGQFIGPGLFFVACRLQGLTSGGQVYMQAPLSMQLSVNLKLDSIMVGEQRPSGTYLPPSHQGWGYRFTLPPQLFA